MSANRPRLAFSGDLSGPLATQLKSYADLIPPGGGAADGLLLDGSVDSTADEATVKAALGSGGLLAVASPGDGISKILLAQTGQSPGPGALLATYRRSAGRAGYDCTLVPASNVKGSAYSKSGPVGDTTQESSPAPEIGPALVEAVSSPRGVGAGPLGSSLSTAGLVPPPGAIAGYSSFNSPASYTAGYPSFNNKPDDKTVGSNSQSWNNQFLTEFFVYWVNGTGTAQPYYVVILRQTGTMALAQMVANNSNSIGWFQTYFQLLPNSANNSSHQPFTSGFTLDGHSPGSGSGDPGIVSISEPMWLYARTQTGMVPVLFNAQANDQLNLQDWAILDQASGNNTAWQYYQSATWNPVTNPYADFGSWWSQVYGNNDSVDPMPPTSYGSIPFEGYTIWKFTEPLFTPSGNYPFNPPPSFGVSFGGGWFQFVSLLHNPAGCTGAEGSTHHHLFGWNGGWNWGWNIDLGQIAQQQNISG